MNNFYFPAIVAIIYLIIFCVDPALALESLKFSLALLTKILPILVLVFGVMFVFNFFVTPKMITKNLVKSSGVRRWMIAIGGGIISTGPIYLWYPLLRELKSHGVSDGFLAAFLYSRAIKPFLFPVMSFSFGWRYALALTIVMILMSFSEGVIIERLEFKTQK